MKSVPRSLPGPSRPGLSATHLQFGTAEPGLDYQPRATAFGLVIHEGKLACVRIDRGEGSYLDLPGGAVDGNETEEQTLVREFLEETGMSVRKEYEMVALARKMDLFSIVYVATPEEAVEMAKAGADAIIAHVGTTVGGSIGVVDATMSLPEAAKRTQTIIDAASTVRKDIIFLSHGGPINTPEDAAYINEHTDAVGFVGASSLERMAVENSLVDLTKQFKAIPVKRKF